MDAIRQTSDVKLTAKAVKTSRFIRKLFGIEAEIGLKNLKGTNGDIMPLYFRLSSASFCFDGIVFSAGMKQSLELSQEGVNYDIEVSYSNGKE